jgi:hypothetical protein
MNLEQAAYVGEILASIATLVTLVYLSMQIRRSNQLNYTESRRAGLASGAPLATLIGESQETSDFFLNSLLNYSELSPSEQLRFDFLFSLLVGQLDLAFADHELGFIDRKTFENASIPLLQMLNLSGGQGYWAKHGKAGRPSFIEYIESKIQ